MQDILNSVLDLLVTIRLSEKYGKDGADDYAAIAEEVLELFLKLKRLEEESPVLPATKNSKKPPYIVSERKGKA